jgi:hypothetical protein
MKDSLFKNLVYGKTSVGFLKIEASLGFNEGPRVALGQVELFVGRGQAHEDAHGGQAGLQVVAESHVVRFLGRLQRQKMLERVVEAGGGNHHGSENFVTFPAFFNLSIKKLKLLSYFLLFYQDFN